MMTAQVCTAADTQLAENLCPWFDTCVFGPETIGSIVYLANHEARFQAEGWDVY
jgi:aminopeptidase-like protein